MRDPAVRRIGLAFAVFNVAEWATWIAMLVYAYDRAGVFGSGLVAVVQLVPAALFAPIAATLADRFARERVLAGAYVGQAIAMAATAAAIGTGAPLPIVYTLAAVSATAITVTRPAQSGLLPALAPTPQVLTGANAALGAIENASILVAPLVAGALLEIAGASLVYGVMSGTLVIGALAIAPLHVPGSASAARQAAVDPRAALRALVADRRSASVVALLAAESVQIGAMDVLFVALALGVLGTGDGGVGILNAALGLGGVAGAVVAALVLRRRSLAAGVIVGTIVWGGGIAAIALFRDAWSVAAIIAVAGVGRSLMDVAGRTLLQRVTPSHVLSGVFGVLEGLSMAALAIGSLLVPLLVELFDVRVALIAAGAVLPLVLIATGRNIASAQAAAPPPSERVALLERARLFAGLPRIELDRLATALQAVDVPAGSAVIREGEVGDRFYVIREGTAEVTIAGHAVQQLRAGASFGEIALLRDVPRTATVTAGETLRLYALDREDFLGAMRLLRSRHAFTDRVADPGSDARGITDKLVEERSR